ncbi:MAG TPA: DoxX family protein [Pyrinomonadaceae bacterium]|nr:DoxX family protein [Pyrinomonadaceae bacterium]
MFPQGGPGFGLLLLRLATAAMFAMNLSHRFQFSSLTLYWAVVSFIIVASISLCIGFLTPALSVIACAAAVANLFWADQTINVVYILRILTSAALFFLGPGAYSIDAKLFGLQVTVVPPRKNQNQSGD